MASWLHRYRNNDRLRRMPATATASFGGRAEGDSTTGRRASGPPCPTLLVNPAIESQPDFGVGRLMALALVVVPGSAVMRDPRVVPASLDLTGSEPGGGDVVREQMGARIREADKPSR